MPDAMFSINFSEGRVFIHVIDGVHANILLIAINGEDVGTMSLGPARIRDTTVEALLFLEHIVRGFAREREEIPVSISRHRIFRTTSTREVLGAGFEEGSARLRDS